MLGPLSASVSRGRKVIRAERMGFIISTGGGHLCIPYSDSPDEKKGKNDPAMLRKLQEKRVR